MAKERSTLQYGVYDPEKRFAHADQIGVEHIFIAWLPSDVTRLRYASEYAASRNRRLMVTIIGVSVYGLEQWDIGHTGKAQDFNDRFREIYSFVSRYNKPVMIAELGVSGGATYRHRWFSQLAVLSSAFPRLRIVVYFNAKEPDPWPDGYGSPDWRIDPVDLSG